MRFERLVPQAASVEILPGTGSRDEAFRLCTQHAMGRAVEHAIDAGAAALQLAVWDGRETPHAAGTAIDVALWRNRGLPTRVIDPTG